MKSLSPYTLLEESDRERSERQRITGVLGNGVTVQCQPDPLDPSIIEIQHRAVCLTRRYPACPTCPHSTFTMLFREQPPDPYALVACPRWLSERDRLDGNAPESYVAVERSRCQERPFPFCSSCPAEDALEDIGASKVRAGWYGRWKRFTKDEEDG